jgi:predicted dienelactone hydrolase
MSAPAGYQELGAQEPLSDCHRFLAKQRSANRPLSLCLRHQRWRLQYDLLLIRSSRMQHATTNCLRILGQSIVVLALACLAFSHFEAMPQEGAGSPPYKIGMTFRRFIPKTPYNWRGAQTHALTTVIWYPAEPSAREQAIEISGLDIFELGAAARDAKMPTTPAKFPLIVISHGTGGSGLSMAWLAEALAKQGYIAAAVNHPGNNGAEPYTVEGFALRWERARDLSEVITGMVDDSEFGGHIDLNRIGAAGFSLGGYTMIEIACGVSDAQGFVHNCDTNRVDDIPVNPAEYPALVGEFRKLIGEHPEVLQHSGESYRDSRVRSVFVMAPALGPAFPASGLKKISIPVEIVAGESDQNIPVDSSAKYFAAEIPSAQLHIFAGNVGHYVFLDSCTDAGRKNAPILCVDGKGADRYMVHRDTARMASEFFRSTLK